MSKSVSRTYITLYMYYRIKNLESELLAFSYAVAYSSENMFLIA